MKKLLIVAPYPYGKAPSQRFRFEQYLAHLRASGVQSEVSSFWADRHWPAIYQKGDLVLKVYATLEGFFRRFLLLFTLFKYDVILIHREATPIGPAWWEWAASRIWRKPLVFDFDDAVWLPNNSTANEKLVGRFKAHHKTRTILKLSKSAFAGNEFLAAFARQFCADVSIVPTTIDTLNHHNITKVHQPTPRPVIGWTGSHSTLRQLVPLFTLLESLHKKLDFSLLIISDFPPDNMPTFATFLPWNKANEIEDLLKMDIGIMPLYDSDWERGKCGFKALQYMALGIPAVVSAVGVNSEIVDEGMNGFICEVLPIDDAAPRWSKALTSLLSDHQARTGMGAAARVKIIGQYSIEAWKAKYVEVFLGL